MNYSSSFSIALLHTVVAKRKGKRQFGRPRRRGEDQFGTYVRESVLESVAWNLLRGTHMWACVTIP
jgi:hypothetical protein